MIEVVWFICLIMIGVHMFNNDRGDMVHMFNYDMDDMVHMFNNDRGGISYCILV